MIFFRSQPPKKYADYRLYRPLLRSDFHYRCAYCLRHEFFLGGEAGCCIDHHRPVHGLFSHPDLRNEYNNLYWCCRECNEYKGENWPDAGAIHRGFRFLDPCNSEDDHDLHLRVQVDGSFEILTNAGKYTCDTLRLWRAQLQHHRAEMLRCQDEVQHLRILLMQKSIQKDQRKLLDTMLIELLKWLEPPVFDRPRKNPLR